MKNLIKISTLCAIIFALNALSVKAQNCPVQNCPFNNEEMTGETHFGHYYVSFYMLPQVAGATYNWYTDGFLEHYSGGWSAGASYVSPYYNIVNNTGWEIVWGWYNPFTGQNFPGWYLIGSGIMIGEVEDEVCHVQCNVTCSYGHNHYFSKKVLISGN